jgi:hypothetical protein
MGERKDAITKKIATIVQAMHYIVLVRYSSKNSWRLIIFEQVPLMYKYKLQSWVSDDLSPSQI